MKIQVAVNKVRFSKIQGMKRRLAWQPTGNGAIILGFVRKRESRNMKKGEFSRIKTVGVGKEVRGLILGSLQDLHPDRSWTLISFLS
jgi:hypothetical protein